MPVTQLRPIQQPSVSRAMKNALAIRGAQTRNLLAEKQLGTFDETQEALRAQRGREEDRHKWAKANYDFMQSVGNPLKKAKAVGEMFKMTVDKSKFATHDRNMKDLATTFEVDPSIFPTAEQIQQMALKAGKMPEQYYEEVWKPDTLMTWEQKSKKEIAKIRAGAKETPKEKLQRGKDLAKFKSELPGKPSTEKGKLTEGAVLKTISEHALYGTKHPDETPEEITARLYNVYLDHRKTGLSREEALNKTLTKKTTPKEAKPTGDYSSLWK